MHVNTGKLSIQTKTHPSMVCLSNTNTITYKEKCSITNTGSMEPLLHILGDGQEKEKENTIVCVYSPLFLLEPPLIRPVLRAAMRPTFLPGGESRATVVA